MCLLPSAGIMSYVSPTLTDRCDCPNLSPEDQSLCSIKCPPGSGGIQCSSCPPGSWSGGGTTLDPRLPCTPCGINQTAVTPSATSSAACGEAGRVWHCVDMHASIDNHTAAHKLLSALLSICVTHSMHVCRLWANNLHPAGQLMRPGRKKSLPCSKQGAERGPAGRLLHLHAQSGTLWQLLVSTNNPPRSAWP